MSHYTLPQIVHLRESSDDLTLAGLRERAQSDLESSDVVIEFSRDVVQKFVCPACNEEEELYQAVGSVPFERAKCHKDGQVRAVDFIAFVFRRGGIKRQAVEPVGIATV